MPTLTEPQTADEPRLETDEHDDDEEAAADDEPTGDEPDSDEPDDDEPEAFVAPEPKHEPEPEPEPLSGIGPEEIGKAERAITAQRRKLAGILGASYVAHDCPLCSALGFLPELPPPDALFAVVQTPDGAELLVKPAEPEPTFIEAPDKAACDWCDAQGFVLTGSKNPNAAVAPCTKCAGNGWVTVPVPEPAPAATAPPGMPGAPVVSMPTEALGIDAWGRPPGHQHWGVPPASVGV